MGSTESDISFPMWLVELANITVKETGRGDIKINVNEAYTWFTSGFSPYQTFRETWDNENDTE